MFPLSFRSAELFSCQIDRDDYRVSISLNLLPVAWQPRLLAMPGGPLYNRGVRKGVRRSISKTGSHTVPRTLQLLILAGALSASVSSFAEDKFDGYLCCNMRSDGAWISDINYAENGKKIIPVGTPLKVTGYGRYRVKVEINGKKQEIGDDYSRDLALEDFAKRYVVSEDPAAKIAAYPRKIQDAIARARIVLGMTREQVLMSVGYPVSSETHDLDDKTWRFWVSSFSEFRVRFDDAGRVSNVDGDADAKGKILIE
jgi:hypothetical protein